jgi:hypothetical protein
VVRELIVSSMDQLHMNELRTRVPVTSRYPLVGWESDVSCEGPKSRITRSESVSCEMGRKVPVFEHHLRVTDLQVRTIAPDNSPGDMASPGELLARHCATLSIPLFDIQQPSAVGSIGTLGVDDVRYECAVYGTFAVI